MIKKESKNVSRVRRHLRVRKKISGTADCPRLSVYRSNKHIHAQIIDDVRGVTLASASSLQLKLANGGNIEAAKLVGEAVAKVALEAGITKVVFDRSGYVYHGRVKQVAEAAREAGLDFQEDPLMAEEKVVVANEANEQPKRAPRGDRPQRGPRKDGKKPFKKENK